MRIPFKAIGEHCVFTTEWNNYSCMTYNANFMDPADRNHIFAEDVRPFANTPESVPAHDLPLAGFPCQPFSIVGVSKKNALGRPYGFPCDTRGTLFRLKTGLPMIFRPARFLALNTYRHILMPEPER